MFTLHVAPNGNNDNPGTEELPFAGIQEACDRAQSLMRSGNETCPAKILVHKGTYHLSKALHFTGRYPMEIRGEKKDQVILEGGCRITGWKKTLLNGKKVLKAALPEAVGDFNQFYVGGKLKTPAKFPKKGELHFLDLPWSGELFAAAGTNDICKISRKDLNAKWYDLQNIEIRTNINWIEQRTKIESYDPETEIVRTASTFTKNPRSQDADFTFSNVKEALSKPGEYYFDRLERTITYLPEKGINEKNINAVIPVAGELVRIDSGAEYLTIENLSFRYAGAWHPRVQRCFDLHDDSLILENCSMKDVFLKRAGTAKPQLQGVQASIQLPGIVNFDHAENCALRNCSVSECGWYGIMVNNGCRNIRLENNQLHHLGGGGIRINGGGAARPELETSHIIALNNAIHDCGEIYLSSIGILMTNAKACLIEHNHIHDLYYSGISCGWVWGYAPSAAQENRIGWNLIHDIGKGVLSDMGGIYLLGIQPGTRVYNNVVHHIKNRYYGGWGIYTDEGSSHIVIEQNLVYDCSCEAYHQHYGRENIVRNNIFAFGQQRTICVSRHADREYEYPGRNLSCTISFCGNVILADKVPFYRFGTRQLFDERQVISEANLFWDLSGKQTCFAEVWTGKDNIEVPQKAWNKAGYDLLSVIRDPGFTDPAKRDFRLKENAYLKKFPFRVWDISKAGIEKKQPSDLKA